MTAPYIGQMLLHTDYKAALGFFAGGGIVVCLLVLFLPKETLDLPEDKEPIVEKEEKAES